jgi:hypothetical protein
MQSDLPNELAKHWLELPEGLHYLSQAVNFVVLA